MKKVNWLDLPNSFQKILWDIDRESKYGLFRRDASYLEKVIFDRFEIKTTIECHNSQYYHGFDFIFEDADYTFLILKFA